MLEFSKKTMKNPTVKKSRGANLVPGTHLGWKNPTFSDRCIGFFILMNKLNKNPISANKIMVLFEHSAIDT